MKIFRAHHHALDLEKSGNTMTVRIGQIIGIDKVLEIGRAFGILR